MLAFYLKACHYYKATFHICDSPVDFSEDIQVEKAKENQQGSDLSSIQRSLNWISVTLHILLTDGLLLPYAFILCVHHGLFYPVPQNSFSATILSLSSLFPLFFCSVQAAPSSHLPPLLLLFPIKINTFRTNGTCPALE